MRTAGLATLAALLVLSACKGGDPTAPAPPSAAPATAGVPSPQPAAALLVTSGAFAPGAALPRAFTCDGGDQSPPLAWSGAQGVAKSYVVIVDDPDAPRGTFTHWILFDIPAPTTSLGQGASGVGIAGTNDFGKAAFGGACPPPGKPHRYFFRVSALDVATLGLAAGARRADVDRAMSNHVVASGSLMATFGR